MNTTPHREHHQPGTERRHLINRPFERDRWERWKTIGERAPTLSGNSSGKWSVPLPVYAYSIAHFVDFVKGGFKKSLRFFEKFLERDKSELTGKGNRQISPSRPLHIQYNTGEGFCQGVFGKLLKKILKSYSPIISLSLFCPIRL